MQDRPTYDELLAAVERFLDDEVVANGEGALRYNGRVAANALRIVRRELEAEEEHLSAEWEGLLTLLGPAGRPGDRGELRATLAARGEQLCERIRAGEADDGDFRAAALGHVRNVVRAKLLVTNPGWLEEPDGGS